MYKDLEQKCQSFETSARVKQVYPSTTAGNNIRWRCFVKAIGFNKDLLKGTKNVYMFTAYYIL